MKTNRWALALIVAVLIGAAFSSVPATAAAKPAKVGLVTFTGATFKGTSANLKMKWPKAKRAKKYQVFMGTSAGKINKLVKTVKKRKAVVRGLTPGKDYFFQVRGVNGKSYGPKSAKVARTTIRDQGSASGPFYRVMTFNLCSEHSSCNRVWKWKERRPKVIGRIKFRNPDIILLQEAVKFVQNDVKKKNKFLNPQPSNLLPGYTLASYNNSKAIYVRTSRFDILPYMKPCVDPPVVEPVEPTDEPVLPCTGMVENTSSTAGRISMTTPSRYAQYAQLRDKTYGNKTFFVASVHTTSGPGKTAGLKRRKEINTLLNEIEAVNIHQRPVIYGGDFNSFKNRAWDRVHTKFRSRGYYDAYDLAKKVVGQHFNSLNSYKLNPITTTTWGDHFDHVFVDPTISRVTFWNQAGQRKKGKYTAPMPSDHSPIVVDVRLNMT